MTEPLGWGLIGTGGIAETFAADLMFTDSGRAVAVGSRQMDSANRFADEFDIPNRHASYKALVADPELGGGALLDLGVYPVSFASMVLGTPDRIVSLIDPAFTGVDGQTSMLFGYTSGAQAILTCTLSAKSPTRAAIVGTDARIEIDGAFYAPSSFELISRTGERSRYETPTEGTGLWHEAEEVARCVREGLLESPLMPLDESIAIMQTM